MYDSLIAQLAPLLMAQAQPPRIPQQQAPTDPGQPPAFAGFNPDTPPLSPEMQRQMQVNQAIQQSAGPGAMQNPSLAPQPDPPGKIKQYFANILHSIGEASKAQMGMQTDFQEQQARAATAIAQQNANTNEAYKDLQGRAIEGGLPSPVSAQEAAIYGVPEGTLMTPKGRMDAIKQRITNQGKTDVATINQGVQVPVPDDIAQKFGLAPGSRIGDKTLGRLTGLEGKNLSTQSQMVNGVPHKVIVNKATGETVHDLGVDSALAINAAKARSFADAKASVTPFQTFDENGKLTTISAGQAIASGVPAASSWNALYGATGSTKSQGQAAGAVAEHIPAFQQSVQRLAQRGELGPVMGRLNTYLTSGYGGDDPDIAEFVTTAGLLKSGAVRAHFGARGGAQILSKFDGLLNTAQTPEALIGSTNAIQSFLNTYKATGSNANTPKTTLPGAGGAKGGFTFHPLKP